MNTNTSYIDDYTPPTSDPVNSGAAVDASVSAKHEKLEDQNIFTLLGVEDGDESEKSQFLDQLQQVIWEDFLENDVSLLVLDSEHQKLKELIGDSTAQLSIETQEKVIEYLEELIPDLEEIMVDKAIRLKADLFKERVESLKKLFAEDSEKLMIITTVESHVHSGSWASAAATLNSLK